MWEAVIATGDKEGVGKFKRYRKVAQIDKRRWGWAGDIQKDFGEMRPGR
jgi:hypothetical protein